MKLALVGVGKIATEQHVPAINASPDWELAATASLSGKVDGVEPYTDINDLLNARPDITVVSLCIPPAPRFAVASAALRAGRHVMLEKPPGATLAEVHALTGMAGAQGVSLFATWHSRMAYGVAAAKNWLADKEINEIRMIWREDVRKTHPGQEWIFESGGMGAFDPGINSLSMLTEILPMPVHLTAAELDFPANRQSPIAARLNFTHNIQADFDFRETGAFVWDIEISTNAGNAALRLGGNIFEVDGKPLAGHDNVAGEYPALYARMAQLVKTGQCDVDLSPMVHVADAFTLGRRNIVENFEF